MLLISGAANAQVVNVFDLGITQSDTICEPCLIWDRPLRTVSIPPPKREIRGFPKTITWGDSHNQVLVWPKEGEWASEKVISDLENQNWTIGKGEGRFHIRIMDNPKAYGIRELPAILSVDDESKVLRRFANGCGMKLDAWAIYWIATGKTAPIAKAEVSVTTSGNYPLRGNWWSVDGKWSASKSYLLSHLRNNRNHRGKFFQRHKLESWSYAELQSLHSDDHEGVRRSKTSVTKPSVEYCPT